MGAINLGHMLIISAKKGLQANASVSITVAPPGCSYLPSQSPLVSAHSALADLDNAWVARGKGLQFVFRLDQERGPVDRATVEELEGALLWQQLGLEARLEGGASSHGNQGTIVLALRHVESRGPSSKRKLHKLGEPSSGVGIRPPEGIAVWELTQVELAISFAQLHPRRKRRGCRTGPGADGQDVDEDMLEWSSALVGTLDTNAAGLAKPMEGVVEATASLGPSDMLFDELDIITGDDNRSEPQVLPKKPESRPSQPVDTPAAAETLPTNSHAVSELVDATVRLAICERPSNMAKGIRVRQSTLCRRLSEAAPSLFSPGYLAAVADRAVLLPIIGHSLVRVPAVRDARGADGRTSNKISTRLWAVLQREVRNAGAARKLAPIQRAAQAPARPARGGVKEEEMFEPLVPEGDGCCDMGDGDLGGGYEDLLELDAASGHAGHGGAATDTLWEWAIDEL